MAGTPNPNTSTNVGRIVIAGSLVGILIIALFLGSWFLLGSLGVSALFRLIISICLPPMLLLLVFGGYVLFRKPQARKSDQQG